MIHAEIRSAQYRYQPILNSLILVLHWKYIGCFRAALLSVDSDKHYLFSPDSI